MVPVGNWPPRKQQLCKEPANAALSNAIKFSGNPVHKNDPQIFVELRPRNTAGKLRTPAPSPCWVSLAKNTLLLQTTAEPMMRRGSGQGDYENTASLGKHFPRATQARGDESGAGRGAAMGCGGSRSPLPWGRTHGLGEKAPFWRAVCLLRGYLPRLTGLLCLHLVCITKWVAEDDKGTTVLKSRAGSFPSGVQVLCH